MKKGFDHEVSTWNSLYDNKDGTSGRYAIFQEHAIRRTLKRRSLCVKLLNPGRGMKILDIGCGSGAFSTAIEATGAAWTGMDISFKMLLHGRKKTPPGKDNLPRLWINGSINALPFADEVFDGVVCAGVINFFRNEQLPDFLKEIARVLLPGGILVFSSLRLDVLTWIRSRLYPAVPLPFSSPGPLFPLHFRKIHQFIDPALFDCTEMIHVRKYMGLPHYTLLRLVRK